MAPTTKKRSMQNTRETALPLPQDEAEPTLKRAKTTGAPATRARQRDTKPNRLCSDCGAAFRTLMSLSAHMPICREILAKEKKAAMLAEISRQKEMDFVLHVERLCEEKRVRIDIDTCLNEF